MKSRARKPGDGRRAAGGNVTMADIGRLAGVSQVTVSRALSAPAKVSPETLERIRDAIRVTGFVPNAVAGALASNKSRLISALVPSVTNIVYASMLHAFSNIMLGHGYQLMLSETGFDPEREEAAISAHLSRRPDALLLTGIHHSAGARRMLLAAGIPVVEVWDITETPIDCCVGFSHGAAGVAAAEFAHAAGYRQAVTVTAGDERAIRRRNAFVDRFRQLSGGDVMGVDFDSTATLGAGRQALVDLLDRGMPRGCLVFCSSDQFAQGILVEARARGLSVPGDLAVIGFGDQEFAAHLDPALTSIRVDRDVLGRVAANALLARFERRADVEAVHDVGFEIIRRASA
ncbi:LacI family DNA-binding transcriptional regulator [Devosia sp. XGJD_8]|uniref:LacI family DNA-binding transcriptional regulator n=1 Tax=Devosia sp. XGJD_8 TaxID=3391187 RepID=UPI003985356D